MLDVVGAMTAAVEGVETVGVVDGTDLGVLGRNNSANAFVGGAIDNAANDAAASAAIVEVAGGDVVGSADGSVVATESDVARSTDGGSVAAGGRPSGALLLSEGEDIVGT